MNELRQTPEPQSAPPPRANQFESVAATWGACGPNSPTDKVVRTFDRAGLIDGDHRLVEGRTVMYCGTENGGFRHVQVKHWNDWGRLTPNANWRLIADEGMEAALRNPEVVCYREDNNTFTVGRLMYEYNKKNGLPTGRIKWANVTVDANTGRVVTSFPTSGKPRCKQ
ncbi:hypothetical protein [Rhodococcus rhodnii]|uniref:hypothetical protein n=1 Tax=Rhodococcus rhodnii TaxID=38312 RepID=UPI000B0D604F|nr:hypothetical protein [Rhodococcus rhodnii]